MRGNVDRISEGYVIIRMEDNSIKSVIFDRYPYLKAGDVIFIENGIITVDKEATEKLKERIIKLQRKVFK